MGCIYMRTSPSGKSYIGQTMLDESERWKKHCYAAFYENGAAYNYPLSKAIRKYGANSFTCEILEDNITSREELDAREIYWISHYNTYKNGLNATHGGEGNKTLNPEITKQLWNEGYCVRDIVILLDVHYQTVLSHLQMTSKECQKRGPVVHKNKNSAKTFGDYKTGKPIIVSCYNMQTGEYIKTFASINEAVKSMGGHNNSLITKVIHGKAKSAYGFYWKEGDNKTSLSKEILDFINNKKTLKVKPVVCVELKQVYSSSLYAQELTGVSNVSITNVCNGWGSIGGGYHWRFVTDEDIKNLPVLKKKRDTSTQHNSLSVMCVETGKVYISASDAGRDVGVSYRCILKCCRGESRIAKGFHWKFAGKGDEKK